MAVKLEKHTSPKFTPPTQPIFGTNMIPNSGGGYSYKIDDWARLTRFLVLGTEGGTFYASEKKLTRENTSVIQNLIQQDGKRVLDTVLDVSDNGKAYKNDYALFVLALCIAQGNIETKKYAEAIFPRIARTASHLTTFIAYVTEFRGWGKLLRRTISSWYNEKASQKIAYQITKYANRNGWTHKDILRLSHPHTDNEELNSIYKFICKNEVSKIESEAWDYLRAVEEVKALGSDKAAIKRVSELIGRYRLPHEVLTSEQKGTTEVWEALLDVGMPITALIRNIGVLSNRELLNTTSKHTDTVTNALLNKELLKSGRIHPLQILSAYLTYKTGHGAKGNLTWNPTQRIMDALDESFYLAFDTIVPTGKVIRIGLDVSSSMSGGIIHNIPNLTPRVASAVLCMATVRTEKKYDIVGFSHQLIDLSGKISAKMNLDTVVKNITGIPFGSTDSSLPVENARQAKERFDAFVIYTDNETNTGNRHASQALKAYRKEMNVPDAKMIVVGMTAVNASIADTNDVNMLDVCGLSTDTPSAIANFIGA